jgi:hypothetical protein
VLIRTSRSLLVSEEAAGHPLWSVPLGRGAALLAGVIILTFPVLSLPYRAGLDFSWMIGLQEALDRGFVYGRDIGFAYGPLGHLFYPFNKGETPTSSAILLLALYVAWWISIALVLSQLRRIVDLALFTIGTVASGALCQQHIAGAVNILLLAALGFFIGAHTSRRSWWAIPGVVLTVVGLLAKFNIGVACLGALLAYLALGLLRVGMRRALLQGALLLGLFVAALVILFRITNGPVSYLGNYLRTYWLMSEGYQAQMSISHSATGELMFLLGSIALCLLAPLQNRRVWRSYAPLLFILSLPLFLAYKAAFVRCEPGHVILSSALLPALLCLLLPAGLRRKENGLLHSLIAAAVAASLFAASQMEPMPWNWDPAFSRPIFAGGPRNLARAINWNRQQASLRKSFEDFRADQALPTGLRSRIGDATVDVYPSDISLIVANRLNWSPRYVLQSYAAYHPALDALDAEHYRGPRAPRFILFRYDSIDWQHPCLVDSQTWLEIYRWYDLAAADYASDLLLLERRPAPRFGEPELIESRTIEFDQELILPQAENGLLLLRADMRLNLPGKIRGLLYKQDPPWLRIEYVDGEVKWNRLVWRNLAGGALVSDLPRNLGAVSAALGGKRSDRVRALKFAAPRQRLGYEREIKIELLSIHEATTSSASAPATDEINPHRDAGYGPRKAADRVADDGSRP